MNNAYILEWTIVDFELLKNQLTENDFSFEKDDDEEHINVTVSFETVSEFAELVQEYINSPQNYIDLQFTTEKTTVIIFKEEVFYITSAEENIIAKKWALENEPSDKQPDWKTSF